MQNVWDSAWAMAGATSGASGPGTPTRRRGEVSGISVTVLGEMEEIFGKGEPLGILKSFQAGECLFCILPLCKQEGLGYLYQVHQPSGVYYKHEAHGNQICPGEDDAPAD